MKLTKYKSGGVFSNSLNKKGFTLLEVLAVIIVLAVIALITVPIVTSTMKDARKSSFKTSMLNLVKAADNYYADNQLDITNSISFDFVRGGVSENGEELAFKGTKPQTGRVIINVNGEITLQDVSDGNYYANYNSSSDDDVIVTEDNEILTRDELTERLKKLEAELTKKADKIDLEKTNTQLSSTTTIANTANQTANSLANTRLDKTYPVGSIYISYASTNPASLFGGTWVNYGSGRMLKGISSGNAGSTGGASSVTLTTSNLPSHTHSIPALSGSAASAGGHNHSFRGTTSSSGAHTHSLPFNEYRFDSITGSNYALAYVADSYRPANKTSSSSGSHTHTFNGTTSSSGEHTHTISTKASTTGSTGSTTSFNIENPYITVYMWRRTA